MKKMGQAKISMLIVLVVLLVASVVRSQSIRAASIEGQQPAAREQADAEKLIIEPEPLLPEGFMRRHYEFRFLARYGVRPVHWKLEKGALPRGLTLDEDGLLSGQTEQYGEFQFTVSATDSGRPPQAVQKEFILRIRSAMSLTWKTRAHGSGNRIEGSVTVANSTPDDIDLTYIVLAVPSNGRATAIGYQHFVLRSGGGEQELPFGETLPRGGYAVHVDAIGEVEARRLIYRERLQTTEAIQINVGP